MQTGNREKRQLTSGELSFFIMTMKKITLIVTKKPEAAKKQNFI